MNSLKVIKELKKCGSKEKSLFLRRFFKTGKGQYGEGDEFVGVTVPEQRIIAKKYLETNFSEIQKLLKSPLHEARLTALFILVYKYKKADNYLKEKIYNFYLKNIKAVNNWDLVDTTVPHIIGAYLWETKKSRKVLYAFLKSKNLWERRIAIVTTWYFIKNNDFKDTLNIAEKLLKDSEDLIHKAVGWMLREVGKKDEKLLEKFLKKNVLKMPRTALRYSIEKFSEEKRKSYLSIKV